MDDEQNQENPSPVRRMSRPTAVFVWTVITLGIAATAYAAWDQLTRPFEPEWLILLALTLATGWATLRIPGMPISFSISDLFSIIAALLVGPSAGALTAALDGLVLSCRMATSVRTTVRVLFNTAAPALATFTAAHVFMAAAGSAPVSEGPLGALRLLALLTVFGVLAFGLNSGTVAVAIGLERGTPILPIWREHFAGLWVSYLGGVFAAMLLMVLSRNSTSILEVLILIAPIPVILYVACRHALGRAEDQIEHLGKMNAVYVKAIEALAQAIDAKDQVTHDHIRRVQEDSLKLARALHVNDELELQAITAASLLHDVGKLGVPEHILNKPGRLSPSEFQIMKRHAPVGADILSVIDFPYPVAPIVRHHHENWDGTGYPDGLSGEAIPIGARILAVVDCFDALTSDRPYRPRLEDRDALQILADRRGNMYDPQVVDAFFAMHADAAAGIEPASASTARAEATIKGGAAPETADAKPSRDLETFFELGRELTHVASAPQIGGALWSHLQPHLPACAFILFTYHEGSDSLIVAYEAGESPMAAETRIPLGERMSGWVAAARQAIVNSDARLDLDEDRREASLLRSALAMPVFAGNRTVGVLTFYSRQQDAFTEGHRRIVEAAAYVVSDAASRLAREDHAAPAAVSRTGTSVSRS